MEPILTPTESAALDRESRDRGVTVEHLMESAGRAVARAATAAVGGTYGRRAVVICGKGNNGGDGLVAARYLIRWGVAATVVLLPDETTLREPSATMLQRLEEVGGRIRAGDSLSRELARADVAVDAIFGTGFRGQPEDVSADAIEELNASGVPVVAVDIPSGVDGETGAVAGEAVIATVTVTFGAPKPGLLFHPGASHAGIVEVVDIGFPPELVRSDLWLVDQDDIAGLWPHRDPAGHKRRSGVLLVIAGSRRMTGAVRLVAEGAYRAGAGLVTVAVPEGILSVAERLVTEGTFLPLPETADGTIGQAAFDVVSPQLESFDAVAIGPGMTAQAETASFVQAVVANAPVPIVADADALNAFAGHAADLARRQADLVLTPHDGEFVRLAGGTVRELGEDRLGRLRKLAAEVRATVLLKGRPALTASPSGEVRLNPTGGPSLSTGGTGDVLTGIVGSLLARGRSSFDAATAGAFVHGVAGDLAGLELGEGATAVDVLHRVPDAVRRVTS
jgi:ADP-dependent NAD(P)H-hydrate dehydratase / NAD(P)H-hydrate epimerase